MIRVVDTGRNPTMRYIGRVHRIAVSWLHERLAAKDIKDPVDLEYTKSEDMAADIYTKAFSDPDKWDHALQLIAVFLPKRQQEIAIARIKRLSAAPPKVVSIHEESAAPAADGVLNQRVQAQEGPRTWAPSKSAGQAIRNRIQVKRFASIFSGSGHLAQAFADVGLPAEGWDIKYCTSLDLSLIHI